MDDGERAASVSGERQRRRGRFGCVLLLIAVLITVGILVWIDQRHIRDPQPAEAAPAQVPPEIVPALPVG